jgi:hypothetical protein
LRRRENCSRGTGRPSRKRVDSARAAGGRVIIQAMNRFPGRRPGPHIRLANNPLFLRQ